jgi:hypothetical protein
MAAAAIVDDARTIGSAPGFVQRRPAAVPGTTAAGLDCSDKRMTAGVLTNQ